MPVLLRMRPKDTPRTKAQFLAEAPPFSIAIDGYVIGAPWRELDLPAGPYANFNHHEEVSRVETRATCAQALMAVRTGLYRRFRTADGPNALVWANDCDEDVCLSWYILNHGPVAESLIHPTLNRLVDLADKMDTMAGMWPLSTDVPLLRRLAWVMEPYRLFRSSGSIDRRDEAEFTAVVTDVCGRIDRHLIGEGGELSLDTRYERIGGGPGWAMIREIGTYGRQAAFKDGITAFVSVRQHADGRYNYVVGRMSEFDPFPVPLILALGRAMEPVPMSWGGGTTIGGSDRAQGSAVDPASLEKAINNLLLGKTA